MSLKHRKLGRTSDQRRAMLRAMVTYLLENGQIKTTITRAKEVAPLAEKKHTLAETDELADSRPWLLTAGLGAASPKRMWPRSCFRSWAPSMPAATAATPALSASVPAAATTLRWPSSSWCNSKPSPSESPTSFRAGGALFF